MVLNVESGVERPSAPRLGTGTSIDYVCGTEAFWNLEVGQSALLPKEAARDYVRVRLDRLKRQHPPKEGELEKKFSVVRDLKVPNQYRVHRTQ